MPFDGNKWNSKKMVSYKEMLTIIAKHYEMDKIIKLTDDKNDTSKVWKSLKKYFQNLTYVFKIK